MVDENNLPAVVEEPAAVATKKTRAPRKAKAPAAAAKPSAKAEAAPAEKRRGYSEGERAALVKQISGQLASGTHKLGEAVKNAGISMKTYYLWKGKDKPAAKRAPKAATSGNDLSDLVQLEAENNRLRALLAEKLRAENLELRKRLGL